MTARLPEVLAHAKFEDIVSELVNPYPREPGSVWQWAIPKDKLGWRLQMGFMTKALSGQCSLFELIRQGLWGESGPQHWIRAGGERDWEPDNSPPLRGLPSIERAPHHATLGPL